jgi:hypothetical protein
LKIGPRSPERFIQFCYWSLAAFTLLLAAGFVLGDRIAPAGKRLAKITGVDAPGYFGVSHALLFHRNFDFSEEYNRVKPDDNPWTALRKETGHYGSVHGVGYSILAAPFLAAGTLVDGLTGSRADGYSRFAILGYCLANVVLTGLGLMALFAFIRGVAEFWGTAPRTASFYALFAATATFFGTNVGYYAVSPMSHAATFFCVSLFLAYWWRVRERTDVLRWVLLGLIGGVLSITRWQDILFLAAPILSDLFLGTAGLMPLIRSRLAYGAAAAFCWTPQLLEWKYIFGKYLTVPTGDGFFVFPPPFVLNVLFSTRNGWVPWTPLVLLGLAGLIWAARREARLWVPWIVVIVLEIVLIGSTRTWHGGESFSARYLTCLAPLIALGLVNLLCFSKPKGRLWVMSAALVFCLFSFVTAIQFRLDLIPRDDRLTLSEYVTDKFRLFKVMRRKLMVRQSETLLIQGSPAAAVAELEAAESYGLDRDVLAELSKAYRASGRESDAQDADRSLTKLMDSRMF